MIVDKDYCMSSFLQLRTIYDHNYTFKKGIIPTLFEENDDRKPIYNSYELENELRKQVHCATKNRQAALCLSGGIDSAILAKFMPKGSIAYTFKCIVPGIEVVDETHVAAQYAKECGLVHKVVEIYWEDFEKYIYDLMRHKGAPIHSIEVQIYKAALQAKADGIDTLIFGESADVNFGGQDGLLSKDWTTEEYMNRFSFVMPYKCLINPIVINEPFIKYSIDGKINAHEFNRHVYYLESVGSYYNAMGTAHLNMCCPYSKTYMGNPLDLNRIRNGENKYLVREIFSRLYPDMAIPNKTPMPRPMNEWMMNYSGPKREEFISYLNMSNFTGDQKWLIYSLEQFLNLLDEI